MNLNRLISSCRLIIFMILTLCSTLSQASGQPAFNKIVFFGDSLSDNGNLYSVLDGYMPKSPPYFDGRFSNGKVWSELVSENYQQANITSDDYAVGGETAILHNPIDGYLPFTITASLYDYLIRTMYTDRSNVLFFIWIGANDYLPGVTNPDELSTHVISNIQSMIDSLIYHGAKHIIVINLPDLSKTPYAKDNALSNQLEEVSKLHNAKLETMVNNFQDNYKSVSIHLLDVNSLFNTVVSSKLIADTTTSCWGGKYTFRKSSGKKSNGNNADEIRNEFNQYMRTHLMNNTANAKLTRLSKQGVVLFPDYAANNPALLESYIVSKAVQEGDKPCDNPDEHAFWDHVHPTRVMHELLAKHAIEFIDMVEAV